MEQKIKELNEAINKLKNEKSNKSFYDLESNCRQMSKHLEELRSENSYLMNKLKEMSQNQTDKNNKSLSNTLSLNKISFKNVKKLNNKSSIKPYNYNNNKNKTFNGSFSKNKSDINNYIFKSRNKNKPSLKFNEIKTLWKDKIPLFASYFDNSINNKSNASSLTVNNTRTSDWNNSSTKMNFYKTDKFMNRNHKIKLKQKFLIKSLTYNKFFINKEPKNNSKLINELNEKNKIIKKLNNSLVEQNKIAEDKISLLIKDKNKMNEKLFLMQKEKDEYKNKKEYEIKKYIKDLNNNQKTIKELYNENNKILKSKKESELQNQKLKNIILENRLEYENLLKNNNNLNNFNLTPKNENEDIENDNNIFRQNSKSQKAINSEDNHIKNNEINTINNNGYLNDKFLQEDIKNESHLYSEKGEKKEEEIINKDNKNENIYTRNSKKQRTIKVNDEEIKIFNNYLKTISENKNNQILLSNLRKEIESKNNIILKLEEKVKENLLSKEKEKEQLQQLLNLETQKSLKLKEFAEEQQKKYKKYKTKCEEYKKKSVSVQKEAKNKNSNLNNNNNYYVYKLGSSFDNDNGNFFKLREDIFQLKQQLDEERSKTEVLKLLAENEKEKIENYKNKYNQTKKLNATLLNKLKEREIHLNKEIINENEFLKKQLNENKSKTNELKLLIQKLNNEIEVYKKKIEKIDNEEKIIKNENSILKNNLNLKEDIIKENNNKINEINIKYAEEKSKNSRLSLEIKELFYENKRLISSQTLMPKSNKNVSFANTYKTQNLNQVQRNSLFGTRLNFNKKRKEEHESLYIRKVETMKKMNTNRLLMEDKKSFNKSDNESNDAYKLKIKNKLKSSDKVLNIEDNENNSNHQNNISSSDFSYEDNDSELNRKKKMMKINIIKSNEDDVKTVNTINTIKENEEDNRNYSSFTNSNNN